MIFHARPDERIERKNMQIFSLFTEVLFVLRIKSEQKICKICVRVKSIEFELGMLSRLKSHPFDDIDKTIRRIFIYTCGELPDNSCFSVFFDFYIFVCSYQM